MYMKEFPFIIYKAENEDISINALKWLLQKLQYPLSMVRFLAKFKILQQVIII